MNAFVSTRRRSMVLLLFVAGIVVSSAAMHAQEKPAAPPANAPPANAPTIYKFTATATNLKRVNGETITIELTGWSPDAEREKLVALLEKGPADVLTALQAAPSKGKLWRSGSAFGMYLRYAVRLPQPDGTERIILAVEQDLSDWQQAFSGAPSKAANPFTILELRVTSKGTGEGKLSISSKIVADAANKTLALDNYAAAPMVLKIVKREGAGAKAVS